jgi:hypothetical protein
VHTQKKWIATSGRNIYLWHAHTPIFHNNVLCCRLFASPKCGILTDIMDSNGLRTFQDLEDTYNSFFLYLLLKSAMLLQSPLGNPTTKPYSDRFINTLSGLPNGLISIIYKQLLESSYSELAI